MPSESRPSPRTHSARGADCYGSRRRETGGRNASVTGQVWVWNRDSRLGFSFDSSAGYTLPNGATRSPDASWIAAERWDAISPDARKRFAPICPDFVVELRSPSDDIALLRDKMREYVDCGARLGWLIDPVTCTVEIYRPSHPVETLARPVVVSGEDVLPDFSLDLRGILFD